MDRASHKARNLDIILQDHILCELKAAQSATLLLRTYVVDKQSQQILMSWLKPYEDFIYRGVGSVEGLKATPNLSKTLVAKLGARGGQEMVDKMVLLIKEELHHFYQVLEIMAQYGVRCKTVSASRYAKGLFKHVRTYEPEAMIDKLIVGAYIEARSCERFAQLAPYLDDTLQRFYLSLLRSEARHYQDYLSLATLVSSADISERVDYFAQVESTLILSADSEFRFHSGMPQA